MAAAGTPWSRLYSQMRRHPKTRQLARALGIPLVQAVGHLAWLYCECTEYHPDGSLAGLDAAGIADAAAWEGDPVAFVDALAAQCPGFECGILEGEPGTYTLHGFFEANETYRRAVTASNRRGGGGDKDPDCRTTVARQSHDSRGERRGEERIGEDRRGEEPIQARSLAKPVPLAPATEPDPRVGEVVEAYVAAHGGKGRAQAEKPDTRTLIRARLHDGYTVDELRCAIAGNKLSAFHREKGLTELRRVMADAESVDRFVALAAPGDGKTDKSRRNEANAARALAEIQEAKGVASG